MGLDDIEANLLVRELCLYRCYIKSASGSGVDDQETSNWLHQWNKVLIARSISADYV